ncbi:MAG: legume lectin beta domain protein, partial [Actinomycetia bacterium]|nr:legume lectin beta domain protein [Actinomycetes bacterium]
TTTLPPVSDSSWTTNGFTTVSGTTATLTTDGQKFGAGSLVNSRVVSPLGLHATFTAQIGGTGTTGGDGLTMALLDASTATPTSLGGQGGGLGVAGLPATFVALETYPNAGVDTYNFAAVGTSTIGATGPTWLGSNTTIPPLRTGTHTVDVTVTAAGHLVVKIDGSQVLDVAAVLPSKVLVAFTAGVGGSTDTHAVLNPTITYAG